MLISSRCIAFLFSACAALAATPTTAKTDHFDVYLIGGQSNAVGLGAAAGLPPDQLTHPDVMLFHSAALASRMPANTFGPLRPAAGVVGRFGPELGLGVRLAELNPGASIAILKHATGGTGLDARIDKGNNWHPGTSNADAANFGKQYEMFVQTVNAGLQALTDEGHTYTVRGMHWQQGERDTAFSAEIASAYGMNLAHFIGRVREQFNAPDMVFTYGTVLNGIDRTHEPVHRAGQEAVDANPGDALATPGAFVIPMDDTSVRPGDEIHIDRAAQLELGRRAAERMLVATRVAGERERSVISIDFSRSLDEQGDQRLNESGRLYYGSGPAPGSGPFWNTAAVAINGENDTVVPGTAFDGLLASDGMSSDGVAVDLTSGFFRAFNAAPGGGNVLQDDRVFSDANVVGDFDIGVITVSGLDPSLRYDFYLIGASTFDTTYSIGGESLSDAVGDGTASLNADGSLAFVEGVTHVRFGNVMPDAAGRVEISVTGNGQRFGVLSALQIAVSGPGGVLDTAVPTSSAGDDH